MGEWQPIETAPKDETEILACWQYIYHGDTDRTLGQFIVEWSDEFNGWEDQSGQVHKHPGIVTHWMPLPAPPQEDAG